MSVFCNLCGEGLFGCDLQTWFSDQISVEVANDEEGKITCPFTQRESRWPRKVIIFGLKGSSVVWLPKFRGVRHRHWNLNWELPVSYLGSHLYFIH